MGDCVDDKPASAHAKPRIPATQARPATSLLNNPGTSMSHLANRMAEFAQRRGAMPVASSGSTAAKNPPDLTQRFKTMNVARKKSAGRPKGKGVFDPRQSTLNFPPSPVKSPQKARRGKDRDEEGGASSSESEDFPSTQRIVADKVKSLSTSAVVRKPARPSLPGALCFQIRVLLKD